MEGEQAAEGMHHTRRAWTGALYLGSQWSWCEQYHREYMEFSAHTRYLKHLFEGRCVDGSTFPDDLYPLTSVVIASATRPVLPSIQ